MDKKTKTILTVGVLAAVGYLVWKQTQKKSFANAVASPEVGGGLVIDYCGQLRGTPESQSRGTGLRQKVGGLFGNTLHQCCSGQMANRKPNNIGCQPATQQAS